MIGSLNGTNCRPSKINDLQNRPKMFQLLVQFAIIKSSSILHPTSHSKSKKFHWILSSEESEDEKFPGLADMDDNSSLSVNQSLFIGF